MPLLRATCSWPTTASLDTVRIWAVMRGAAGGILALLALVAEGSRGAAWGLEHALMEMTGVAAAPALLPLLMEGGGREGVYARTHTLSRASTTAGACVLMHGGQHTVNSAVRCCAPPPPGGWG